MNEKPHYAKSMPALGTTQDCERWPSEIADKVAKDLSTSVPVEQVGPLRVTVAGIEGTFVLPEGYKVQTFDSYSVDPAYEGLFHRQGCSIQRNDRCICEYLGQWDA